MTSTKQEARAIWHSTTALTAKPQKRGKTHARLPDSWRPDAFITPTVLVVDMNKLDGLTPERKPSPKRISIKAPTKAPSKIVLRDPNAAKTSKSIAPARAPATPTKIPKPVSKLTEARRATTSTLNITDTKNEVDFETRIRRALSRSVRFKEEVLRDKDETIRASNLNPMAKEFSTMKACNRPQLELEIPDNAEKISNASSEPLSDSTKVDSASSSPWSATKSGRPALNYDIFRPIKFPPPGLPVPDAPGREAKHMDPKLASPLLEKFTEKYPLTGSRKPAIKPPKLIPPALTPAKRRAAVIQQQLELLLLQEKEKKAVHTLGQTLLPDYSF